MSNGGTDIHQHLWPERLLGALAERSRPPLIKRSGAEWVLKINGEPDHRFSLADHDPGLRAEALDRSGLERALISLSGPLGIESLPAHEAAPLLEAFHAGVLELDPAPFGAWGSLALRSPDPRAVDALLDRGFVGVTIPAGALASREGLDRLYRVLHRLELRGAPLFVHPGPDPLAIDAADTETPTWWPAMTAYIADMNAAWHAFAAWGRRSHPRLRVVFAMLAGGAPLHLERLAARGGPRAAGADTGVFYDTSSYGERAVDAVVRQVGIDQVIYGSDRPVVDPPHHALLGPAAAEAMSRTNVGRLFDPVPHERVARIAVAA